MGGPSLYIHASLFVLFRDDAQTTINGELLKRGNLPDWRTMNNETAVHGAMMSIIGIILLLVITQFHTHTVYN